MSAITSGQRVVCRKEGAFNGQYGTVEDVWQGVAYVTFGQSSLMEPVEYFEPA